MLRALHLVPLRAAAVTLRESFWFLPLLMLLGAAALALGTLWVDRRVAPEALDVAALAWVRLGGHDGSRTMLAALAGSIMTVAGVVFSVTMAVLTLTSSQFGPRLLRNFLRDRGIQVVLGTFLATFLHAVLVMLALGGEGEPLPRVSVLTSTGLTVASLLAFVYFVHHVATQVQADRVIAAAARDLDAVIAGISLGPGEERPVCRTSPPDFDRDARRVGSPRDGYVTALDLERLIRIARAHDAVIHVDAAPGHFVSAGETIARVVPDRRVTRRMERAVKGSFYFGTLRTPEQDLEFAIEQVVEVGVRAMSPGINDPFTAVRCVDRLEAGLGRLFQRQAPPSLCGDERGDLRVVVRWATVVESVAAAFAPLRNAGRHDAILLRAIARSIGILADVARAPEVARALEDELRGVREAVDALDPGDQERLRPVIDAAVQQLERRAGQLVGDQLVG